MYSKNGVVYKLHAGWFINRTQGEFINSGLFTTFKGLLCGNPIERGESLIPNFWPRGSLQVQPRHRDCLPQAGGFRTYIKYLLHCQVMARASLHQFQAMKPLVDIRPPQKKFVNNAHARCIVKTSGFTRGVCKNRGFY